MSFAAPILLELRLGPLAEDQVRVRAVRGVEALSEPFAFTIELTTAEEDAPALDDLLGAAGCLALRRPEGTERLVNGICTDAERGADADGRPLFHVTLRPKLALLGDRRRCRVWQNRSVVDVARAVLDEHGVTHRSAVSGAHPSREMCIQYRETDLAFVSRILAEEGIVWWFEHSSDDHELVLADAPSAFPALPDGDALPVRRDDTLRAPDEEHVATLRVKDEVRPAKAVLRGFDFERPLLDVTGTSADGSGQEHYDYPAGVFASSAVAGRAKLRLEALRTGGTEWTGTGNCARLAPGYVFETVEHPKDAFNARQVVLSVAHEARQSAAAGEMGKLESSYENRFRTVPAGAPVRAERRHRRPVIAGPQTATVVGPSGEEIHVDEHGRVKVQFHWDREGKRDDASSAWVRLAQAWSGAGFGALYVPRIGQEVVVRFLEGNPDRPLVVGAVFNGANPPPVALPDDKTQSTLRTDSSPHGGGYNELRLEDRAGEEQIFLHGQKDERIEVLNDKRQAVGHDEALRVEKDRSRSVGGYQTLHVAGAEAMEVQGNQTLTVAKNRRTEVGADHVETVTGSNAVTVGGKRHLIIQDAAVESVLVGAALTVGGAYAVNVAAAVNEAVGGLYGIQVAGNRVEIVGAARDEQVKGDASAAVGGDFATEVVTGLSVDLDADLSETISGDSQAEVKEPLSWMCGKVKITAQELALVVGGKLVLSMKSSGQVEIAGTSVTVVGSGPVSLKGAKIAKSGGAGPSGKSARVKRLKPLPGDRSWVEISLQDQHGRPIANVPFRVEMPDGKVRVGTLDGGGSARVPGSKEGTAKVTFPRLDGKAWKKK